MTRAQDPHGSVDPRSTSDPERAHATTPDEHYQARPIGTSA
jgi:hypothetical protein